MPVGGFGGALGAMVIAINSNRKLRYEFEVKKIRRKEKEKERKEKLKITMSFGEYEIVKAIENQIISNKIDRSDINCPECAKKMCQIKIKSETINYCILCKGSWLNTGIMSKYTDYEKDVPSDHLTNRKSRFDCPVCNINMREYVFLKPYNLLVDQCTNGHGVYLENGEFERAIEIVNPC